MQPGSTLYELTAWAGDHRWIVWILLVLVVAGLVDFAQRRLIWRLRRHVERTRTTWDDVLVAALGGPVSLAIWVLGIALAANVTGEATGIAVSAYVAPARTLGLVVALAWFGLRLVRGIEASLIDRYVVAEADTGPDRTTIEATGKLLRAAVAIIAALVAMQSLGLSISGLIAFGGIGGIALGFAARDLLANFFGSIMVHLDRQLKIGEWVRSPDRDIEGTVEHIGWRLSRIRRFDMRPLYVPNSVFASVIVENPSRMTHRRIYETVGIRYGDVAAMDAITRDVQAMLDADDRIDSEEALIVNFDRYGESSLDFFVYCLTTETRWAPYHAIKQEVLLGVADIVRGHGAEIAFPTRTLHLAEQGDMAGARRAAARAAASSAAPGSGSGDGE